MKDVSYISGAAVMPPKWALGYMQSHRELRDDERDSEALLTWVVDTFREKRMPLDAVIYLGTGFTPTGWNTRQPSFDFNPEVFQREPPEVLADLHARNVRIITHIVPWRRGRLATLHGTVPPAMGEVLDRSHAFSYWQEHIPLVHAGVDAWWPDEGDWFDLYERVKRHQLYYQGPLWSTPNVRPWSLHRNGHLGVAQWGGWVWSGDPQATWKTLEVQVSVGINHSLSLSPYWGSDTGGFYTTSELTGELYARWFQFSAFTPSFRSHGRIWRLRLPWGWGLSDMGFPEGQTERPPQSEMNNAAIEPITRKYAELRYQLIPYTYTLAREARDTGMPLMRALWLHYPEDERARGIGSEYLWGRDLLVAPVFKKGLETREVYLPAGVWYDWWSNERHTGGQTVTREVDLSIMPIYARAGAIIPFDPRAAVHGAGGRRAHDDQGVRGRRRRVHDVRGRRQEPRLSPGTRHVDPHELGRWPAAPDDRAWRAARGRQPLAGRAHLCGRAASGRTDEDGPLRRLTCRGEVLNSGGPARFSARPTRHRAAETPAPDSPNPPTSPSAEPAHRVGA